MNVLEKVRSLFRAFGDLQAEVRDLRARLDAAEARIAALEARPVGPLIPAPQTPLGPLSPYPWPDPGPYVIDPSIPPGVEVCGASPVARTYTAETAKVLDQETFRRLVNEGQHLREAFERNASCTRGSPTASTER